MTPLDEFTKIMAQKLDQNAHKGGRPAWLKENPESLFGRLEDESHELEVALIQGRVRLAEPANCQAWAARIAQEAADVANFAMMIADACGGLPRENSFVIDLNAPSITCKVCGLTSFNVNDVNNRYCGHCHRYH